MLIVLLTLTTSAADMRMIPSLGDARTGELIQTNDLDQVRFAVKIPEGVHHGLTATAWMKLTRYNNSSLTTFAEWCPDPIQWLHPDLLDGAGAEIDLDSEGGSKVFSDIGYTNYADVPAVVSNAWPRGVYTLAGDCTDNITVTVGGTDVSIDAGEFNCNVLPGPSDDLVISGSGVVNIGVSKTPCYQIYQEIDGVSVGGVFSYESIITNEFAMCVWRWKCKDQHQIYRSDLGRLWAFDVLSLTKTNSTCEALHSDGMYMVGLCGLLAPPLDVEVFDTRVFARWLADEELERIHINGVQELIRRGVVE